ncbi:MAG: hypothetical protein B6242_14235 [Anaerolineaceae bacterium 4572_78]|nr:MAG: hypothetical protein B6242_14235 [Anaerolineaceae bacterium 4572_78]
MKIKLVHEFVDESLADKTRWFSSLTVAERIAWLDDLGYDTAELVTPDGLVAVKFLIFENGIKIDVMLNIPGLDFVTAWANRETMYVGEQVFYIISKTDLIASKLASGRKKDLTDVVALQESQS